MHDYTHYTGFCSHTTFDWKTEFHPLSRHHGECLTVYTPASKINCLTWRRWASYLGLMFLWTGYISWSSSKKRMSLWLCLDLCKLNTAVKREHHQMPTTDDGESASWGGRSSPFLTRKIHFGKWCSIRTMPLLSAVFVSMT